MTYTIKAVNPEVRTYTTKFGDMASYKVMFNESPTPVEISQKATTPPPTVGQALEGTIDMSGQYGPKFKKEYAQQGNFGGSNSTPSGTNASSPSGSSSTKGSKFSDDPFTMYLSYAKDLAVAKVNTTAALGNEVPSYTDLLDQVLAGAYQLYEGRPGAEPAKADVAASTPAPQQANVIDAVFAVPDAPMTEEDLPWPEPNQL